MSFVFISKLLKHLYNQVNMLLNCITCYEMLYIALICYVIRWTQLIQKVYRCLNFESLGRIWLVGYKFQPPFLNRFFLGVLYMLSNVGTHIVDHAINNFHNLSNTHLIHSWKQMLTNHVSHAQQIGQISSNFKQLELKPIKNHINLYNCDKNLKIGKQLRLSWSLQK